MAPRKQTYEERLAKLFHQSDGWVTGVEVGLRFGPDYREAMETLYVLINQGVVSIHSRRQGERGPKTRIFELIKEIPLPSHYIPKDHYLLSWSNDYDAFSDCNHERRLRNSMKKMRDLLSDGTT